MQGGHGGSGWWVGVTVSHVAERQKDGYSKKSVHHGLTPHFSDTLDRILNQISAVAVLVQHA